MELEFRDGVWYIPTIERDLGRAGYPLTEEALVAALRDPRARVRSLAVEKLAKDGRRGAVPSIMSAFSVENDLGARLWMAYGLAKLGEEKGAVEIANTCKAGGPIGLRLTAASLAMTLGKAGCNDAVVEILRSLVNHETGLPPQREGSELSYIYSLLNGRSAEFKPRSGEIRGFLEGSLTDSRDAVRMFAANTLGTFGNAGSLEKLRQALAMETVATVRARLAANVAELEEREHDTATQKR
jgi:hypothetical protein